MVRYASQIAIRIFLDTKKAMKVKNIVMRRNVVQLRWIRKIEIQTETQVCILNDFVTYHLAFDPS